MKILVTGGFGYIGSHFIKSLDLNKHEVFVIDDLSTGYIEALEGLQIDYSICDIRCTDSLDKVFRENEFDIVYDFAAKTNVEESVSNPEAYYDVNVIGLKNLLDVMVKYGVKKIIFSSTAAVYGQLDKKNELINEQDITVPSNPYGETKLVGENMLKAYSRVYDIDYIIFRYFNVVGSMKIGEKIENMTTIVPKLLNAKNTNTIFNVFGGDYQTKDGTCIRDYIHIHDLIAAHILILGEVNKNNNGVYNLSIGRGTSVLELISIVSEVTGYEIKYEIKDRRYGDPVISAASNTKFINTFAWKIDYNNVSDMIKEASESYDKFIK